MTLCELIESALVQGASDVHLSVDAPPLFRLEGSLIPQGDQPVTEDNALRFSRELASPEMQETYLRTGEADFAVTYRGMTRMRCNLFRQRGHTALALRLLPLTIPTVAELQLPEVLVRQAEKPRGLVLITGPTGSGKSSTLAALLEHINHTSRRHIITLEEPVEYLHRGDLCLIHQREVGSDTASFAAGLRAALRQDPDVILVGEMRDLETISTAITAAETGHLVFATLHTKGAANTVDRIIDSFPADQQNQIRMQLADVLECACGQTLLPCIGGGRRAVFEIMVSTPAIRSMILQNKTFQLTSAIQTGRQQGMRLLDDALQELADRGVITAQTALSAANKPETLKFRR